MKKNAYLYVCIAVIGVFTICFFAAVFKSSYAFPTGKENDAYEAKVHLIEKTASAYAENNEELFGEGNSFSMTVDELVKANYLVADNDEGDVKNPSSDIKTLNDLKIVITKEDGKISAKLITKD